MKHPSMTSSILNGRYCQSLLPNGGLGLIMYTSATGSSAERNGVHYSIVTAYAL